MLSNSFSMLTTLSIDMPKKQRQQYSELIPVLEEISRRVQLFNNDDQARRQKDLSLFPEYYHSYRDETLINAVTLAQTPEARKLQSLTMSNEDLGRKMKILNYMNEAIKYIARILSMVHIFSNNGLAEVGACQELSEISASILTYLYGSGLYSRIRIETVAINTKVHINKYLDKSLSHEMVVINRSLTSELKNLNSWGDDCCVFDPYMNALYTPETIPKTAVLSEFRKANATSKYEIQIHFDNGIRSSYMEHYISDPIFGRVVRTTLETLQSEFDKILSLLIKPFLTPEIIYMTESAVFNENTTISLSRKSTLVNHLEKVSGLSFLTVKTHDWRTHNVTILNTPEEESMALKLIKRFEGHGLIRNLANQGKIMFFPNTNDNETNKDFRQAVWMDLKNGNGGSL